MHIIIILSSIIDIKKYLFNRHNALVCLIIIIVHWKGFDILIVVQFDNICLLLQLQQHPMNKEKARIIMRRDKG